ncbi:hypothetical protein [Synechococcus sp. PCC 7336]|uniref:hypothetical protein n=1 Tax=Synechococcus sp. PCC 7336 TaxID=195250 RepID=UPI00034AEA29|nr:hypothetical protein [Synechococcus sp. PCC 7336]
MTSELGAPIPPKRPQRPIPPKPKAEPPRPASIAPTRAEVSNLPPPTFPQDPSEEGVRNHPIAPPDAPMQFRAIGLVEGRYEPSEEQFTRGTLYTPDGGQIDAVLLGRVMSLVRKYLQPERDYMWVVYPRTSANNKQERLHLQVAGVWAPEEIARKAKEDADLPRDGVADPAREDSDRQPLTAQMPNVAPGYFSIRGEVVRVTPEQESVTVKIVQNARNPSPKRKTSAFKLYLKGKLPPNSPGQFWDLEARRQDATLEIVRATAIGPAPKPRPKKRRKSSDRDRPHSGPRHQANRSASGSTAPPPPKPQRKTFSPPSP